MCTSKPKTPAPPAPPAPPESVDQQALNAGNRQRRRAQTAFGQQSTILTGAQGAAVTAQSKTLLGS